MKRTRDFLLFFYYKLYVKDDFYICDISNILIGISLYSFNEAINDARIKLINTAYLCNINHKHNKNKQQNQQKNQQDDFISIAVNEYEDYHKSLMTHVFC